MKKLLLIAGLLLIGAGCSSTDNTNTTPDVVIANDAFTGTSINTDTQSDDVEDTDAGRVSDEVKMEGSFVDTDDAVADDAEEDVEETSEGIDTEEAEESDAAEVHTPEDGWDVALEFDADGPLYRVRVDSKEKDGSKAAVIEYAADEDTDYVVIHSFTVSTLGETTFSADDSATSFIVIEADEYERHSYFLVDYSSQKVYPLDKAAVYYLVTGGLDGTILTSHSRANGDGGLHLEYYNDEKVDCVVYDDGEVDGSTIELEETEVTFEAVLYETELEEGSTAQEYTLDYVEECNL